MFEYKTFYNKETIKRRITKDTRKKYFEDQTTLDLIQILEY